MKNFKLALLIFTVSLLFVNVSAVPFTGVLKEDPFMVESPKQILNFSLSLDESEIYRLWDLSFEMRINTTLEEKTFFDLFYLVLDSDENLIYFNEEKVEVIGNSILERNLDTRKAQELDLGTGEYSFIVRVVFGGSEESFKENFKINRISNLLYSLKQLFDIRFELEDSLIYDSENLRARVIFESFGSEPTPVNLTFMVIDEKDDEFFRKETSTVVETEKLVLEDFLGLDLEAGKYKLVLRTVYNVDVVDYFEQDFEVRKKQDYWFLIFFGLILILGIYFVTKEMMKSYKEK